MRKFFRWCKGDVRFELIINYFPCLSSTTTTTKKTTWCTFAYVFIHILERFWKSTDKMKSLTRSVYTHFSLFLLQGNENKCERVIYFYQNSLGCAKFVKSPFSFPSSSCCRSVSHSQDKMSSLRRENVN